LRYFVRQRPQTVCQRQTRTIRQRRRGMNPVKTYKQIMLGLTLCPKTVGAGGAPAAAKPIRHLAAGSAPFKKGHEFELAVKIFLFFEINC
jgi:hypothetical protein